MTESQRKFSIAKTSTQENNIHHIKITRKKQLFLLFYTTGNNRGDNFMYFSAKTREINIKNEKWFNVDLHLVLLIPIQDISSIIKKTEDAINQNGGEKVIETKELSIFSHSWFDGPTGSATASIEPVSQNQMQLSGWSKIDAKWASGAKFVMFGCNSATDSKGKRVFGQELSECPNLKNVEVWGQTAPSKPSFYPDKRDTSSVRNSDEGWDVNFTYMVGSTQGDGLFATRGIPLPYPPAKPMKKFMNGTLIERAFQSKFNNHGLNSYPLPNMKNK